MNVTTAAPYSISDVSELTGVPPHTLRSWEKALDPLLHPQRTSGGQRRYHDGHVRIVREIQRRLSQEGQTLGAIRRELLRARSLADEADALGSRLLADPVVQQAIEDVAEVVKQRVLHLLATSGNGSERVEMRA